MMRGWGKYGVDWSSISSLRLAPTAAVVRELVEALNERELVAGRTDQATDFSGLWDLRSILNKFNSAISSNIYRSNSLYFIVFDPENITGYSDLVYPNWTQICLDAGIPEKYCPVENPSRGQNKFNVYSLWDPCYYFYAIFLLLRELKVTIPHNPGGNWGPLYFEYSSDDYQVIINKFAELGMTFGRDVVRGIFSRKTSYYTYQCMNYYFSFKNNKICDMSFYFKAFEYPPNVFVPIGRVTEPGKWILQKKITSDVFDGTVFNQSDFDPKNLPPPGDTGYHTETDHIVFFDFTTTGGFEYV